MFHYKTVWCPYNLTRHNKSLCVYAHNWQDYRRKPDIYFYNPITCHNWRPCDYINHYSSGCKNEKDCSKAHGWKELEYHPRYYKIKPCQHINKDEPCKKMLTSCPFYHSSEDQRYNFIFLS
jgi:hypothetical protein